MGLHSYKISGLDVASQMELPGAIPAAQPTSAADVQIRLAEVPDALPAATASGPTWELQDDKFLLRVPRLARMLVSAGRDICVTLEPDATAQDAAGFVLGTAFGILLHQRGAMVLHGAAVARNGRAIAICGHSGAGKSTLAAALCREGCEFVADDICVVAPNGQGQPIILPDGRQLKLWQESIAKLDLSAAKGGAVRESFEKYFVEPVANAVAPASLSAIYVLREARPPLKEGMELLPLPDALRTLDYQAYRPGLRHKIGHKPQMLAQAAAVLSHCKVFLYTRPRDFNVFPGTAAKLLEHWNGLA